MTTKRSKKAKRASIKSSSSSDEVQKKSWREQLLPLTLTLLAAGLLMIFGAVLDIVVWISPPAQALLGGLFVLISFVLSNALQKQWNLALGWLLLGAAIWLWLSWLGTWMRGLAYLLGGVGLFLLAKEFMRRFWQQQGQKVKKKG